MPVKIVNCKEISREEWLEYRRAGIGGSDAAVIVGLNPWRSLSELYADKLGLLPDKEDNEQMRIGRDLEEYVARRFCEATGKKVRRNNWMFHKSGNANLTATVHCVNEMKFEDVAKLMQYSEEDYRRYDFWVVESEEEKC